MNEVKKHFINKKEGLVVSSLLGYTEEEKANFVEVDENILPDDIKEIKNGQVVLYTEEEKTEQERLNFNETILNQADGLVNLKTQQIKEEVSGIPGISQEQIDRYVSKYKLAVEYASTSDAKRKTEIEGIFTPEATLKKVAVADYIKEIQTRGEKWNSTINLMNSLIDGFRVIFKSKTIGGETEENLKAILEKVKTISSDDLTPKLLDSIFDIK